MGRERFFAAARPDTITMGPTPPNTFDGVPLPEPINPTGNPDQIKKIFPRVNTHKIVRNASGEPVHVIHDDGLQNVDWDDIRERAKTNITIATYNHGPKATTFEGTLRKLNGKKVNIKGTFRHDHKGDPIDIGGFVVPGILVEEKPKTESRTRLLLWGKDIYVPTSSHLRKR